MAGRKKSENAVPIDNPKTITVAKPLNSGPPTSISDSKLPTVVRVPSGKTFSVRCALAIFSAVVIHPFRRGLGRFRFFPFAWRFSSAF